MYGSWITNSYGIWDLYISLFCVAIAAQHRQKTLQNKQIELWETMKYSIIE